MLKSINGLPKNNKNIFSILLKSAFCITALVLLHSCGSSKYSRLNKKLSQIADVDSFANHSYGILVYDPKTNDTLINQSSDKYFIPASNEPIRLYQT